MKKNLLSIAIIFFTVLSATILFYSCQKGIEPSPQQEGAVITTAASSNAENQSKKIYVSNVSKLYAEINNPENTSSTIVLAPGIYMLNPIYPKAGRLELLHNMSLMGQPGHPEEVVIDATELPLSSFTIPPSNNRTGVIRIGDGSNSIEWITFQNDPAHTIRSLIQTDLVVTPTAQIRVAHCIIRGGSIGLSIINSNPAANGRILEANIEDNEITNNTIPRFVAGIQIQNSMGVTGSTIRISLKGNYLHGNGNGIVAFNGSCNVCRISIKSITDRIEDNGCGLALFGGHNLAGGSATGNEIQFEADGTTIRSNPGVPAPFETFIPGGVFAVAGKVAAPGVPGLVNNNTLKIIFRGCPIDGNIGDHQINAYGAYSLIPSLIPAGSSNTNEIYLHGVSKQATVNAINSFPIEPAGTNTVNVYR